MCSSLLRVFVGRLSFFSCSLFVCGMVLIGVVVLWVWFLMWLIIYFSMCRLLLKFGYRKWLFLFLWN